MEIKFKEYSSIENIERTKEINTVIQQGHSAGEWVVSEKIHGSNFSFWVTADGIRCAKRTDWLGDNSSFFNYQDVRDTCATALIRMFEAAAVNIEGPTCMTVYGELFGGNYPHPDVERAYMAVSVQKGVYYHPANRFMAFDIVLRGESFNTVLDCDTVLRMCEDAGLPHVPVLFRGTFDECMAYPNEFQSKVPEFFGLPALEDNLAEGVVLKPAEPRFYWGGGRVILKNKNSKWKEKATRQKRARDTNKENNFEFELSPAATELLDEILAYVTENRLRNVLSKMEEITDRHFGMIVGNMNRDIMEEFLKDFRDQFMSLDEKERKYLSKQMGHAVMTLVRANFVNIIDKNY